MAEKKFQRLLTRARVPLGFLLGGTCLVLAQPKLWSIISGGVVAFCGIFFRAWAAGHVRKNEKLATSGPYGHTRNPLYFGSFLLGTGFSLATARIEIALIFVVFFLTVYRSVMKTEAAHMMQLFPNEYPTYAAKVPLFWPSLKNWQNSGEPFDWQLYLRHREYRALLGMLGALGLLVAKNLGFPKF